MSIKTSKKEIDFLKIKDPLFIELEKRYGLIEDCVSDDIFEAVVCHIIGQMLSLKVANTIESRVLSLCSGTISPLSLSSLEREDLRKCGMSYSKADYILNFASEALSGKYDFSDLEQVNDEEAIKYFRNIKGVGLWTAEMLCLFTLGRANIFSFDDVALRNGIMKAKGYKTLSKKRFESLRRRYSPYCSFASLYFYRINDDKEFELCTD